MNFLYRPVLVPALDRYLTVYCPILLGLRAPRGASRQVSLPNADRHPWVTQYCPPVGVFVQTKAIRKHTVKRSGHALNPPLFRDCAASSIATDAPEQVRIIAQILGALVDSDRRALLHHRRHPNRDQKISGTGPLAAGPAVMATLTSSKRIFLLAYSTWNRVE